MEQQDTAITLASEMKLTKGAIEALKRGANSECLDTNAVTVGVEGMSYYACQFVWEEECFQHLRQPFPEYRPVLEVEQLYWMGTYRGTPLIRVVVTDGENSMEMRPSLRTDFVRRCNFKSTSPLFRGKLNVGKRFTLWEYTTDYLTGPSQESNQPTIFYEEIHAEPKKTGTKSMNRDRGKQIDKKVACDTIPVTKEGKENTLTVNEAVNEIDCQLQRLKIHRSKLGY